MPKFVDQAFIESYSDYLKSYFVNCAPPPAKSEVSGSNWSYVHINNDYGGNGGGGALTVYSDQYSDEPTIQGEESYVTNGAIALCSASSAEGNPSILFYGRHYGSSSTGNTTLTSANTPSGDFNILLPSASGTLVTYTQAQDEIAHSFSRMGWRNIIPFPNRSTTLELTNGFKMDGDGSPYAIYTRGVIVDIDVRNSGGSPSACTLTAYCSNGNTATVSISTAVAEKKYYLTTAGWRGSASSSGNTFMTSYDDYITKIVYTLGSQMQITGTIDASSDFLRYN